MTRSDPNVNLGIALLRNVALCGQVLDHALKRAPHLPGIVAFYGPSGWGKSCAASYCANKFRAVYVACKSSYTKKALLLAILKEMGIQPAKTIYDMVDQIAEQLMLSGRPLIIDEMDHIVEKNAVEIVRDIYESSGAAMLLIGEEQFPNKLRQWERFHNRVLDWQPAQPTEKGDARKLADLYCTEVKVADDLLERILDASRGAARRICVNLEKVRQEALAAGVDKIDLATWGKRELYTGDAPVRRIA